MGLLAIVIALLSAAFYLVLGLISLPHIQHAVVEQPAGTIMSQWTNFTHVILALSGVEAIANMTGVMAEPVGKNSRKAIFVVLAEFGNERAAGVIDGSEAGSVTVDGSNILAGGSGLKFVVQNTNANVRIADADKSAPQEPLGVSAPKIRIPTAL